MQKYFTTWEKNKIPTIIIVISIIALINHILAYSPLPYYKPYYNILLSLFIDFLIPFNTYITILFLSPNKKVNFNRGASPEICQVRGHRSRWPTWTWGSLGDSRLNGFNQPWVFAWVYITSGWWFGIFGIFSVYWECHHPN